MSTSLDTTTGQNAYSAVAASTTDGALVSGVTDAHIRVLSVLLNQGDTTASTVTFNTKGSGAGTAIFPALKAAANGLLVLPHNQTGWFQTAKGESLTVTTGAGSTTAVVVIYEVVR